jgi:hypothetical protein
MIEADITGIRLFSEPGAGQGDVSLSNPDILKQAMKIVAAKRMRDTWEASSQFRVCGCPACGRRYRDTLSFYCALGGEQPERERLRLGGLPWYQTSFGCGGYLPPSPYL